jgi:hypothetical protein
MMDEGTPLKQISRDTGHHRSTIRRWRDDPSYREATYEYDPEFTYDQDDLMDRAVVAHHLCTETPDRGERAALLMAVIGRGDEDLDDHSAPYRGQTRRKKGLLR